MANEWIDGPTYNRELLLPRTCMESVGHKHNYDHWTVVNRGAVVVYVRHDEADGWALLGRYERGDMFVTAANLEHKIKAAEDGTRYTCVFAHRDFAGEVVQEYVGNEAATH